jgi:DNA invertase Pin-like site-specific DNA recombinase
MNERDLSDAIFYFRVSTTRQFEEHYSFESYYYRGKQFGFSDDQIYSDVDSGANNLRKGYQMALAQVRSGKKKRVFVPEFLRLTRSPAGWEEAMEDFRRAGAAVITLEGVMMKFDTPEERWMSRQMVANGALERERNQWRSLKGYEFLRLQGRAIRPCFGYKKVRDANKHTYLILNTDRYKNTNKTIWEIAIEVVETFIECGGNLSETVRRLVQKYDCRVSKKYSYADFPQDHTALRDWLTNHSIRGNLEYFGGRRYKHLKQEKQALRQVIYNAHEPLITPQQWETIQKLLALNNHLRKRPDTLRNPLQKLLFCAGCNGEMKVARSNTKSQYFYYVVCKDAYPNDSNKRIRQELKQLRRCDRRSSYGLVIQTVEANVIQSLCDRAFEIAKIAIVDESSHSDSPEITLLKQQIQEYELMALRDPDLLLILDKKRNDLQHMMIKQQENIPDLKLLREKLIKYGSDPEFWELATTTEKMHLYREFVEAVYCDKGEVTVKLRV